MTRAKKVLILILFNFAVLIFAFLIFEGLSSTINIATIISSRPPLAERLHTEYDQTLGWINTPNIYLEDMYGPGVYLQTNSQRFRNGKDFDLNPPSNKIRLICSGDSFTLGYGVDNDHTWCQQLASLDQRLETVNMGQGGYGLDQAYLWYKRDGVKLNHDIQILAFISGDFGRMQHREFQGYGKPVLVVQDDQLITTNVPVPEPTSYRIWVNRNRPVLNDLNSIKLLRGLFFQQTPITIKPDKAPAQQLVLKLFQDLQAVNRQKNSSLVLVYLPMKRDYTGHESDAWQQFLQAESEQQGLIYIDLIDELRQQPPQSIDSLFIKPGVIAFEGSSGHYTEAGNAFIARTLYEKLRAIPEVAERLVE